MPTVQGTDAFDHGFDAPADYDNVFGTPAAVTTPLYQSRLNTLQLTASASNEGVRKNISGTPTIGWAGFPFAIDSLVTGEVIGVANFGTASGAVARLYAGSTGLLLSDVPGTSSTAETAISPDTFYWIEMLYDCVNHDARVYINGALALSLDGSGTATTISFHQLLASPFGGSPAGVQLWYGGYWAWGSAASLSDTLGEPSVAVGYKRIFGPAQLGTSAVTLYTVPVGRRLEIRGVHVNNPSGGEIEVTASIGTDAAGTRILDQLPIAAGENFHGRRFTNHTVEAGETIQGFCDVGATAVITIDGYLRGV